MLESYNTPNQSQRLSEYGMKIYLQKLEVAKGLKDPCEIKEYHGIIKDEKSLKE